MDKKYQKIGAKTYYKSETKGSVFIVNGRVHHKQGPEIKAFEGLLTCLGFELEKRRLKKKP